MIMQVGITPETELRSASQGCIAGAALIAPFAVFASPSGQHDGIRVAGLRVERAVERGGDAVGKSFASVGTGAVRFPGRFGRVWRLGECRRKSSGADKQSRDDDAGQCPHGFYVPLQILAIGATMCPGPARPNGMPSLVVPCRPRRNRRVADRRDAQDKLKRRVTSSVMTRKSSMAREFIRYCRSGLR